MPVIALASGLFGAPGAEAQTVPKFATVSVASSYACATTTEGDAYCWGNNAFGQLGDGTTTNQLMPIAVKGGLKFKQLVHGGRTVMRQGGLFTCGLTNAGQAHCWGNNDFGELGDGTRTDRLEPTAVADGLTFAALRAGSASACGLESAGKLFCWGAIGATIVAKPGVQQKMMTAAKPFEIELPGGVKAARFIADGNGDPCVLGDDGRGYCWIIRDRQLLVFTVTPAGQAFQSAQIAGITRKCGITTSGELLCWTTAEPGGAITLSFDGFTGRNPPSALAITTIETLSSTLRFKELIGSYDRCALSTEGKVFCLEGKGALAGPPPALVHEAKELTFSTLQFRHSERCALMTGGELYCWMSAAATPSRIGQDLRFSALSIEGSNACAVSAEGELYCWGENADGQIGDGTRRKRELPARVAFGK
jgi:hypothetical protein